MGPQGFPGPRRTSLKGPGPPREPVSDKKATLEHQIKTGNTIQPSWCKRTLALGKSFADPRAPN